MADLISTLLGFIASLVVSTIIIWIVTKLFGEREGFGTALIAALIGSAVYSIMYYLIGTGLLAAAVGGIVWLLVLRGLYDIGWLKSIGIALIVWFVATIIGFLLPTATGPL